ncbi:helix-turn-helix transcriptional regulator [Amycolatopsis sp. CA-128772]|uniref:helix-turn-helix domain-containing protein n=1 Tax=Amycolatopsis sp. CA-128772 TaxID=2073159 RepID=UPI000CCFF0E0|nr:helix-turn-helix transcriptional regulator [Amycolatopsis sp. CA-128772]
MTRPTLSDRQRRALATAARDADRGRRVRATAVRTWYDGRSQADAAARANVSPTTIRRWVRGFQETGTLPPGRTHPARATTLHAPRGTVVAMSTRQFRAALGAELLAARTLRGWSRAQVVSAGGVGYSPAILGHWERGSRAIPLVAFAIVGHALGLDPGEVIRRCYDESFAHVRGLPR